MYNVFSKILGDFSPWFTQEQTDTFIDPFLEASLAIMSIKEKLQTLNEKG